MSSLQRRKELDNAWTTETAVCGLVNGDGNICYHRCYLNATVQLLSGVPGILPGLRHDFELSEATGKGPDTLARSLHKALELVMSARHKVADIKNFVEAMEKSGVMAVKRLVEWVPDKIDVLVQQDPQECISCLLAALETEACTIWSEAYPEADLSEAKLFYSRFSASVFSQAICPHAEICETKTVDGPVSPPFIQTPTLCVGDGGATVELLWENLKSYNCIPSADKCGACSELGIPNPVLSNRQAWANLPDVFFLAIERAQKSGRSQVAVEIQEEVTLSYGSEWQLSKTYDVNRIVVYLGESHKGGHFTVAVRQQRSGRYHKGDLWQYLNSELPAVTCTMRSLRRAHCQNVTGLLLVAKPTVPDEPLPNIPAQPLPTLQVSRSSSSGLGVGASGDDSSSQRVRLSMQEDKRKQELAEMRQFNVRPIVAAADQKKEAKLARQKVYKDTPTSTSQVAAALTRVVAAPLSAELPAKLSAKEQKAAVKKLNKEKKKTPLVLGGAVFNAHPSRATAAAASDVPGVSGAVTSPVSAADTCTAQLSVQMPAAEITPAAATAMEAQVSAEPAANMPNVVASAANIRAMETVATTLEAEVTAEPDANISAAPTTAADIANVETVATAVMAKVPAAKMATELVTAGASSAEAEVFETEDMATALPWDIAAVDKTAAQIPATDITSAVATAVVAVPAGNMMPVATVPAIAADTSAEDGASEAITSAEDEATPSPSDTSALEMTAARVSAAHVTSAVATAMEAEVAAEPISMLAIVPPTAAHTLAVPGLSGVVTSIKDSATPAADPCAVQMTVQSPAADNTPAAATAVEAQVSAEPTANMAAVPATAAETSAEDRVSEATTCVEDAATPAIDTCAAEMTEQIPAADITPASATAMEAHVCTEPAAKMSDVLATSADIRAMETVATTVKAEVTADADISTAPATAAEISAVETVVTAVEATTVTTAQPTQTLLPVKIRLAGSSQIGTDSQVDTPDMGEVALAQGSPFSSAEGCTTESPESEREELGSFPVDCSEYEAEELSTSQADVSQDKPTELSSHPVTDEEDESESDAEYEAEYEEELSSSRPSLVNRAKEWLSCPDNRVAVAGVVGAGCCCLLACLSRRR